MSGRVRLAPVSWLRALWSTESARMEEEARREVPIYRGVPGGQIWAQITTDGTRAWNDDGVTLTLDANHTFEPDGTHTNRVDRDQLAKGVEIRIDGELVGHLRQPTRSWLRSQLRSGRAITVERAVPGLFPPGCRFRLRGINRVSLECDDGPLISTTDTPKLFTTGDSAIEKVRAEPGIDPRLVLLHAAVTRGLARPLRI
ncbi:MAG: hypothetical protein AAF467_17675 [Actinomycetota bacterium]